MAVTILTVADVRQRYEGDKSDGYIQSLIDDVTPIARLAAPCLKLEYPSDEQVAAAKGILRAAVVRLLDAGSGVFTSQTAGPFGQSFDTRNGPQPSLTKAERADLAGLCPGLASVYTIRLDSDVRSW